MVQSLILEMSGLFKYGNLLMKKRNYCLYAVLTGLFIFAGVSTNPVLAAVECPRLSMVKLLSINVKELNGKCVAIKGYLTSDPHWYPLLIYLNKSSYENGIREDAIDVVIDDSTEFGVYGKNPKSGLSLDDVVDSYGEVRGTVYVADRGSFNVVKIVDVKYVWKL